MNRTVAASLSVVALLLMPAVAEAQRAPAKNATSFTLINARSVAVTGLSVTSAAGKNVAALRAQLAPGKRIAFKIPANSGCLFTVNASFADDAEFDQSEVDLCADKNVRLTD